MPACYICIKNIELPPELRFFQTGANLALHLKEYHSFKRYGFPVQCAECTRSFSSYFSLSAHIPRCKENPHDPPDAGPNNDLDDQNDQNDVSVLSIEDHDPDQNDEPEPEGNNVIVEAKRVLKQDASNFLAYLYSHVSLQRVMVQRVVEGSSNLFNSITNILEKKLTEHVPANIMVTEILPLLSVLSNPFDGLSTECLRFDFFEKQGTYIRPLELKVGERMDKRKIKNKIRIVSVDIHIQYIPPKLVFQKFFEIESILEKTLTYYFELLNDKSSVSNFVQGEHWQRFLRSRPKNQIVIPLFWYVDDFENGNALGSHASVHKTTGLYMDCPIIPPEFRCTLKCVFLIMLFYSDDRKTCGNHALFSQLIEDCNDLTANGLDFNTELYKGKIYFQVTLLLGDNLGVHQILGFNESFTSNFPCIICSIKRADLFSQVEEDNNLIRTEATYSLDVQKNDPSQTGIKEECYFNELTGFHCTSSVGVDMMHDIFEGTAHYDFFIILNHFIFTKKWLTVDEFNSVLINFDYGLKDNVNKPPPQSEKDLRNVDSKFKMSASEMLTLINYFGVMFAHVIPEKDKYWNLYLALRKVVSFLMSPRLQPGADKILKSLVKEHNELYRECSGANLKNKFHHLLHYPRLLVLYGNLVQLWCMRLEAYHRISKHVSSSVSSRKNLCKTLAIRHQLLFNWLLISEQFFDETVNFGLGNLVKVESFTNYGELNIPVNMQTFYQAQYAQVYQTKYRPNMVIFHEYDDSDPMFALIIKVLIFESKTIHFIARQLETLYYDEDCAAFCVQEKDSFVFLNQADLLQPKPLALVKGYNRRLYVPTFGIFE